MIEETTKQPNLKDPFGHFPAEQEKLKPEIKRPIRQIINEPEETFNSGYYLSPVSKVFLNQQIQANTITESELPTIFELSRLIGIIFRHSCPTTTDIELAVSLRTFEKIREIAEKKIEVNTFQRGLIEKTMRPKERIQQWQILCERILEVSSQT